MHLKNMLKQETTYTVNNCKIYPPCEVLSGLVSCYYRQRFSTPGTADQVNDFEDGTFDCLLVWRCNGTSLGLGN